MLRQPVGMAVVESRRLAGGQGGQGRQRPVPRRPQRGPSRDRQRQARPAKQPPAPLRPRRGGRNPYHRYVRQDVQKRRLRRENVDESPRVAFAQRLACGMLLKIHTPVFPLR